MALDRGGPVEPILARRHVGLLGGAQIAEREGQGPAEVGEDTLDVLFIVERQFGESDLIARESERRQCHEHDGDPIPQTSHGIALASSKRARLWVVGQFGSSATMSLMSHSFSVTLAACAGLVLSV